MRSMQSAKRMKKLALCSCCQKGCINWLGWSAAVGFGPLGGARCLAVLSSCIMASMNILCRLLGSILLYAMLQTAASL